MAVPVLTRALGLSEGLGRGQGPPARQVPGDLSLSRSLLCPHQPEDLLCEGAGPQGWTARQIPGPGPGGRLGCKAS